MLAPLPISIPPRKDGASLPEPLVFWWEVLLNKSNCRERSRCLKRLLPPRCRAPCWPEPQVWLRASISLSSSFRCGRFGIAASAPHPDPASGFDGSYPRTCRNLSDAEIAARHAAGRPSALRLRAARDAWTIDDEFAGSFTGAVDDVVLRRNDGVAAYNLAVVVDDAAQGIDQVVRGDDLLNSAPRQAYLGALLGLPAVHYAHVPLALNAAGQRLAKRDGAVTLADLADRGRTPEQVLGELAMFLEMAGPGEPVTPAVLLDRFEPGRLPRTPWIVEPADL